jgi:stringent starvation protein B
MTSSRPYLIRAIYEWLVDNQLTPYLMVDAKYPDVDVPSQHIEDGKIVLNIEPQAVGNLSMKNDAVEFDARFSGVARHLYLPVLSIKAIYAFENGRGMIFSEDDEDDDVGGEYGIATDESKAPEPKDKKKGRPSLKIVK